jgi:hypothetical protein
VKYESIVETETIEESIKTTTKIFLNQKKSQTHLFHYQRFDDKLEGNFRRAVSKFNRSKSVPSYVSRASFHSSPKRHPRVSLIAHLTTQKKLARCASSRFSFFDSSEKFCEFLGEKKKFFFVK